MLTFQQLIPPEPVPRNLLPAGLPDIIPGLAPEGSAASIFLRDVEGNLFTEVLPELALTERGPDDPNPGQLELFGGLIDFLVDVLRQNADPSVLASVPPGEDDNIEIGPISLGPRVFPNELRFQPNILKIPEAKDDKGGEIDVELGIIDAGITFWNPKFAVEKNSVDVSTSEGELTSQFASFGGLKLDNGQFVNDPLIRQEEIDAFLKADDFANRSTMESRFPESVWGMRKPRPLYSPEGVAHGTAMTELMLHGAPEGTKINGLELPASVLRDLTGGLMAEVVEVALRSLVDQVIARRTNDADGQEPNKLRLVVLMAFAFTGGPLNGKATILDGVKDAIDSYANAGVFVELILPIGNHLQDQLHAKLNSGDVVGWRTLPDDHSTNTLEVIQDAEGASLLIAQPSGEPVPVPLVPGLHQVILDGTTIGAVWTEAFDATSLRTRISLVSTATRTVGAPISPFGRWRITTTADNVSLWVLRDETGFEADPSQPARASWLEDEHYRKRDDAGEPNRDENGYAGASPSRIRREGSGSLLASAAMRHPSVIVVTAQEEDGRSAFYAGLLPNGPADFEMKLSDPDIDRDMNPLGPFFGRAVLGNAGSNRFRSLGTSMAAAIIARQKAAA